MSKLKIGDTIYSDRNEFSNGVVVRKLSIHPKLYDCTAEFEGVEDRGWFLEFFSRTKGGRKIRMHDLEYIKPVYKKNVIRN
jgi:hypothetical protein